MEIPSAHSPVINGRGPVTKPVNQIFKEKNPEGTFADTVQDVYYSPPTKSRRLTDVTLEKQEKYKELLEQAVSEGVLSKEEAAKRGQTFVKGDMGPYSPKAKTPPGAEILDILQDMDNEQFCLIRHPQQVGDGLYRPMDFYVSPGHLTLKALSQGWETSKDSNGEEIPVADAVVVGAGPGGLTTAWQLARRGGRVVCFESELAGSNFNDGGAKAVHHMRTSADFTNLVKEGHSAATLEHPLSLSGQLEVNREHAKLGRLGQTELTGEDMHGVPPESTTPDRDAPATRGELWDHLSGLAYSLAEDFPDAVLCERSPVSGVTYEDGLFTVTSARGHKIKCKELVLSTGLTGPKGERARSLKIFDDLEKSAPDRNITLMRIGDTQTQAAELDKVISGEKKATLIVNDRLLGDQSLRQTIASFPEGSHAAIIGSGESAIKGALELAHLNPNLTVDLFVKAHMESAQVQVPSENFHQVVIENTLGDVEKSKELHETYEFFGTPVTPRSLTEVFEMQQAGRMRVMELGAYFDEKSMELSSLPDGTTSLKVIDAKVKAALAKSEVDFKSKGLMPPNASMLDDTKYSVFVQAAGYRKLTIEDHPLAQLPPDGLAKLHVNTIANSVHPAQSALPGLGTEGRRLAEDLATRLVPDDRRIDITVPTDRGVDWRNWDPETVDGIIHSGGLHPNFVKNIKEEIARTGSSPQEIWLTLTSADKKLRELAMKSPDEITPAEKEVLSRGLELAHRLRARANEG